MNSLVSYGLTAATVVFLAFARKRYTFNIDPEENRRGGKTDIFVILIIIVLTLFSGLRTGYNDTVNYISIFDSSPTVSEFFANPKNLNLLSNPLFYLITSVIKTFTSNYHVFLMVFAAVTCSIMVSFIHKMTSKDEFPIAVLLFMTFGTYVFTMAAIKQSLAMSVLCLAVMALKNRRYGKFYFIVIIAALIHTYAIIFIILPLFTVSPWRFRSFALIAFSIFIMLNFRSTVTYILEYADSIGKDIANEEIFDGNRMNYLRVAVYSVVPAASLVFRKRLEPEMGNTEKILINMSICSLAFILPGIVSGANIFGRIAAYFELSTVCIIPWIIDTVFNRRSAVLVKIIASACFIVFALADLTEFSDSYSKISLITFIKGLF